MESSIYQPECDRENRSLQCEFSGFDASSDTVVRLEVMTSVSDKSCFPDPIPTLAVKDIESVLPVLSKIVRRSLTQGIFPTILKESRVHPRRKNIKLESHSFSSYRPVANISFLTKVIEKFASIRVHDYLWKHDLFPSLQSAYRQHHYTETTLLKVTDDILKTLDSHNEVVLVMLDLSAAFDTLDHTLLVERLRSYFGFSGTALQWFSSYLHGRSQSVIIGDTISPPRYLEFGVPQGSILGPLLFTLYIAPLQDVIQAYNLNCMFYADDSQVYSAINPNHLFQFGTTQPFFLPDPAGNFAFGATLERLWFRRRTFHVPNLMHKLL